MTEFEITIEPEPDDLVIGIERTNRQIDERARDQALADFQDRAVGQWTPRSEVASWPPRFREAYEAELRRLEGEREEQLKRLGRS